MSKKVVVQFSDGKMFFGNFDFYSTRVLDSSKLDNKDNRIEAYRYHNYYMDFSRFMELLGKNDICYLKPAGSNFYYTKSSIVKISEVDEEEIKSLIRDSKLDQII